MSDPATLTKQLLGRAADRLHSPVDAGALRAAEADLDDAISTLDAAGYRVQAVASPDRGLSTHDLHLRLYDLSVAQDIVGRGAEAETLRATVRARLHDPGSAVLERFVAALAGGAQARPLWERVASLADDLPYGEPDAGDELRRATELAFRAALVWAREVASSVGEGTIAAGIGSLETAAAGYLAGTLREEYAPELPPAAAAATRAAADALESAQEVDRGYSTNGALEVSENAAAALQPLFQLDPSRALELARATMADLLQPRSLPVRDLR